MNHYGNGPKISVNSNITRRMQKDLLRGLAIDFTKGPLLPKHHIVSRYMHESNFVYIRSVKNALPRTYSHKSLK